MLNTNNMGKWKALIKGNLSLFLVLTIILTIVLNGFADKGLTYLLNINNQTIFTYNYSLGIFGIILAAPAAFFSIWIIKGALRFKERFLPPPVLNKLRTLFLWCFSLSLKLIKVLMKMAKYTAYLIMSLVFLIVALLSDGGSSRGGYSPSGGSFSQGSRNSNGKDNLKKEAEWQARQKQKEADYAQKQAIKQANYNMNTYHFDNRVNRANALQREANEAKKRARNL